MDDVLSRLQDLAAGDLDTTGGRTLGYVYSSGLTEVDRVAREAVAAFAGSNGLDPTAFPSLLRMENDLVGFALDLLDAPDGAVGSVTSGGTESCLLAVQAARDAHPEVTRPRMVLPATTHAAFHKAAHYFGVEPVLVPAGPETGFRANAEAVAATVAEDPGSTVLVVASAPSYAHGVVDPVASVAATAAAYGVRCHVDACIGGWVLPWAQRLGREVPPWTFAVPGVTSLSVDLHKYAYAPKGTSLLLHRTPAVRAPQFFASSRWPGYTMLNSTMQSTRSGGPLAGAWAVVQEIGAEGYARLAAQAFAVTDHVAATVAGTPGISVLAPPDSTLLALVTDESCDVFTLADELAARGWHTQPQFAFGDQPANLHLTLSAATAEHRDELDEALPAAVAAARAAGPVAVDTTVREFIASLDPEALTDEEFDGLLAATGLTGGSSTGAGEASATDETDSDRGAAGDRGAGTRLVLPERMAEINALLDLASPAMREALLMAFLDRLSRPHRGAAR